MSYAYEARAVSVLANVFHAANCSDSTGLAKKLIHRHGSLAQLIKADKPAYQSDDAAAYRAIKAAFNLVEAGLNEQLSGTEVCVSNPQLLHFLRLKFHGVECEQLHAIFLDKNMRFIRHEIIAIGNSSKLKINTKRIINRCIELGASSLILSHNHPSGSALPSDADRENTKKLQRIALGMEISIADHIILGARKAFSMRLGGLL